METARSYYNSESADQFYFLIWGGEDIHIGFYEGPDHPIKDASEETVRQMINTLPPELGPETKVLDIGAGYGGAARHMAKVKGWSCDCLNLSEVQNKKNREFTAEQGLQDKIRVYDGTFEDLPFEENSYDVVWSQDAILHSGDREKVLREVDRVLKPGGYVVITDPMQSDNASPENLQPVYDRIHLANLGSVSFYREEGAKLGWELLNWQDESQQLVNHYSRVRAELEKRYDELAPHCGTDYLDRMKTGLGHWIEAGKSGDLQWGILLFKKTA